MEKRLEDHRILVTGASSGIGRALCVRISEEGAKVCLVARNADALEETRKMMERSEAHIVVPYDLLNFDNYGDIFGNLKEQGFVLDGMVHCAGTTQITPIRSINRDVASKMMDIHYYAFLELVKRYSRKGASNGGSIVAVSAINAHTPQKCMTAYAAAKSAVETACRTMALELNEKGIRINSVVVGGLGNRMDGAVDEQTMAGLGSTYENPVGRQLLGLGEPNDIAKVIAFLLSEDASFITGRELYADGGLL